METELNFDNFSKKYSLRIPDYQRAYSWEEAQWAPFLNDILEHYDHNDDVEDDTVYYLGHYILETVKGSMEFDIVDGQQRFSTVFLFLLTSGYLSKENYIEGIRFTPVSYDSEGLDAIKSVLDSNDNVNAMLSELVKNAKTVSLKRMANAVLFFIDAITGKDKPKVPKMNIQDIGKYVEVLRKAYCSVAVFEDKAVASQIFELHNTRGVKLTETEKVKALLMKNIYIHSGIGTENDIAKIQDSFSTIFKLEEEANKVWLRGEMSLDTILMYHLRAVNDGNKNTDFSAPHWFEGERGSFQYVKDILANKSPSEKVQYALNLASEFARSMEIITIDIPKEDSNDNSHLIGDILLLDRNKSLVFLLRAFRVKQEIDYLLIKRWENFMLCYDIIYWCGFFHRTQHRGRFDSIYASLKANLDFNACNKLLLQYYKGEDWFGSNWEHLGNSTQRLFQSQKHKWTSHTYGWSRAGYFLYKYETHNGADVTTVRKGIFKDNSLSIDHIVARGLSWESLGYHDYSNLKEEDEKRKEADQIWDGILTVINGIGNLALSTTSSNSSDSNGLPAKHRSTYQKKGLTHTFNQVKNWNNANEFAANINTRSEEIIEFIYSRIVIRNDLWEI